MSAGAHIGVMCLGLFSAVLSAQNCLGNNLPTSAPIARQNAKKRPSRAIARLTWAAKSITFIVPIIQFLLTAVEILAIWAGFFVSGG